MAKPVLRTCSKCGSKIEEGEPFYCLVFEKAVWEFGSTTVLMSDELLVYCKNCFKLTTTRYILKGGDKCE